MKLKSRILCETYRTCRLVSTQSSASHDAAAAAAEGYVCILACSTNGVCSCANLPGERREAFAAGTCQQTRRGVREAQQVDSAAIVPNHHPAPVLHTPSIRLQYRDSTTSTAVPIIYSYPSLLQPPTFARWRSIKHKILHHTMSVVS